MGSLWAYYGLTVGLSMGLQLGLLRCERTVSLLLDYYRRNVGLLCMMLTMGTGLLWAYYRCM